MMDGRTQRLKPLKWIKMGLDLGRWILPSIIIHQNLSKSLVFHQNPSISIKSIGKSIRIHQNQCKSHICWSKSPAHCPRSVVNSRKRKSKSNSREWLGSWAKTAIALASIQGINILHCGMHSTVLQLSMTICQFAQAQEKRLLGNGWALGQRQA